MTTRDPETVHGPGYSTAVLADWLNEWSHFAESDAYPNSEAWFPVAKALGMIDDWERDRWAPGEPQY